MFGRERWEGEWEWVEPGEAEEEETSLSSDNSISLIFLTTPSTVRESSTLSRAAASSLAAPAEETSFRPASSLARAPGTGGEAKAVGPSLASQARFRHAACSYPLLLHRPSPLARPS